MRFQKSDEWKPTDGLTLEANAYSAIRTSGSILVTAGPGAGKTELLAQKTNYLFATRLSEAPLKILAISFKTDSASNLKERVTQRCGNEFSSRFISMTYDAYFKSIVDHFRSAIPEEYRPDKNYRIVNENDESVLNAYKKAGFTPYSGMKKRQIDNTLKSYLNSVKLPIDNTKLSDRGWLNLVKGDEEHPSSLTFGMINQLAIDIVMNNPKIRKALSWTYSHIFLDEFQDTTSAQYQFVKEAFQNTDIQLTAVGDSKQRIMLWAGARKTVFEDFKNDFSANSVQLLMNHRSAPRLVALQKQLYNSLHEKSVSIITSSKWNDGDGIIELYQSDTELKEAEKIVESIKLRYAQGIMLHDMCILCKQTPDRYTACIISALKDIGFRARIETEYQTLLKEPIVDIILKFLQLSINRRHPQAYADLCAIVEDLNGYDFDQSTEKYHEIISSIETLLKKTSQQMDNASSISNIVKDIITFLDAEHIKAYYPQYKVGCYLRDCLESFINLFSAELELACNNWDIGIRNFLGENTIPIMTIHKSKGLEYTDVYFVGLEDAAFWTFKNQSDEDRCSFFVALSRAKEKIAFTYCSYRETLPFKNYSSHEDIQEFFDLLIQPGIADLV